MLLNCDAQGARRPWRARAQVCARPLFQGLNNSFAQLFPATSSQAALSRAAWEFLPASGATKASAAGADGAEAPEACGRRRLGRCVSGLDEAENKRKRKECFAKRNERFRSDGRKSLRSLGREINEFREIGLTAFLFRAFAACAPSTQKAKPSGPPFDKLRAGLQRPLRAPWAEALDRAVFSGARIASAGRGLEKAARRHGGESVRTSPR